MDKQNLQNKILAYFIIKKRNLRFSLNKTIKKKASYTQAYANQSNRFDTFDRLLKDRISHDKLNIFNSRRPEKLLVSVVGRDKIRWNSV